jgi:hypothetical protein
MSDEKPDTRAVRPEDVERIAVPRVLTEPPSRVWSDAEWERIQRGYLAGSMDEKWNVYVEGEVAYLHRSWTGHGICEARFARVEGGWQIASAVVEGDVDRYRHTGDEFDRVVLELVLSAIVLGEPAADLRKQLVALSRTTPGSKEAPAAAILHSTLGLRSDF